MVDTLDTYRHTHRYKHSQQLVVIPPLQCSVLLQLVQCLYLLGNIVPSVYEFSYLLWVHLLAVLAEDILGSCAEVVVPLRPLTTQIQELQEVVQDVVRY